MLKNKYLNDLYDYGILLLVFMIPVWRTGSSWAVALTLVISMFLFTNPSLKTVFWYFVPLLTYHLVLNFFIGYNSNDILGYYRFLIILVILPIVFFRVTDELLKKTLIAFILGTLLVQLHSVWGVFQYYLSNSSWPVMNNHAKINEVLLYSRPMLGFISAISVLFSISLFRLTRRKIYLLPMLASTLVVFYISARLATLLIIIFFLSYSFVTIRKRSWRIALLVIFTGISFVSLKYGSSNLSKRFLQLKDDSRIIIWKNAFQILKENDRLFTGTNDRTKLVEDLKVKFLTDDALSYEPRREWFLKSNYHVHNQYLDELIVGGIIGLILLAAPLLWLLFLSIKKGNLFTFLVLVSLAFFLLVENVFERQRSIFIFSYLIILIYKNYTSQPKIDSDS